MLILQFIRFVILIALFDLSLFFFQHCIIQTCSPKLFLFISPPSVAISLLVPASSFPVFPQFMILHFPTLFLLVPTSNLPLGFSINEVGFPVSHFTAVLVVFLTSTSPSIVLKCLGLFARATLASLFPVVLATALALQISLPYQYRACRLLLLLVWR